MDSFEAVVAAILQRRGYWIGPIGPALSPRGDRFCPFADNENNWWLGVVRFNPELVIDGTAEFLLATKVALRGLDRYISEQELNLIEFTAGEVAQSGARAPQVMRGELLDPRPVGGFLYDLPDHLRRHPITPNFPGLID
jgi:hypothetical protein